MSSKIKIFLVLIVIFLCGCATIYNPATQKKEFIIFDTKTEVSLGKSFSKQIEKEFKLLNDEVLNDRLEIIGKNVSTVSDRQDLEYHFFIVDDDQLNAFALPGGFIYVNKGVLDISTDDELACVLGHEIGHVAAKHSMKKLQAVLGYQILINIAFRKSSTDLINSIDIIFNIVSLGYSRKDERLADKLGVKYAWKAGYNPEGMITFFYKLRNEAKKLGPHFNLLFLSSHPPIEERIKNVKKEIGLLLHKDSYAGKYLIDRNSLKTK